MIHDLFDFHRWQAEYPLDRVFAEMEPIARRVYESNPAFYGEPMPFDEFLRIAVYERGLIVGPINLVKFEQARKHMLARIDVGRRVPTDVFVWARGEPKRREVTKLGGLPFRRADTPWPLTSSGQPMTFVGRFCFADSRDIAPDVPADVLLIFAAVDYPSESNEVVLEWIQLGESDLIKPSDVPKTDWPILPCHGQIHRSMDYPDVGPGGTLIDAEFAQYGQLGLLEATKIGGVPWWEQGDPNLPGRFLCVQESVWHFHDQPWPFLNRPHPISWDVDYDFWNRALCWGDVGRLYFHLEGDRVHWEMQCG